VVEANRARQRHARAVKRKRIRYSCRPEMRIETARQFKRTGEDSVPELVRHF
jgi:hypothetical protein